MKHQNISIKALCSGFVLNVVNDLVVKNKYNFLQNIRITMEGILQSRPKVDEFIDLDYGVNPVPNPIEIVHSIKTIVNKNGNLKNRIAGAGDLLFTGAGNTLIVKDTGFSGKPLHIVDFRPEEAIEAYAYIGDENKFKKVSVSNEYSDVGINAPTKSLSFQIAKPVRKIIDDIVAASVPDWDNRTGTAQVPAAAVIVNTTIAKILYDDAVPNFASIVPTAFTDDIKVGRILTIAGVDKVFVEEVNPSAVLAGIATVANISYDAGVNGLCTIVLSTANIDIKRNSVLLLNGVEYIRVIEVTRDSNNIPSIRCSTVGTIVVGNSVEGKAAFRIFANAAYVDGATLFAEALTCDITADGVSSITKTIDIDLTNADNKPLGLDDFFHISFQASLQAAIKEVHILLDCNNGPQNFTDNYYQHVLTQNFFAPATTQTDTTISTIQQVTQRRELLTRLLRLNDSLDFGDNLPGGIHDFPEELPINEPTIPTQTSLGDSQWTELFIKLRDFTKVGSDASRTLKDIKAIRIVVETTGAMTFLIDSLYCGGGDALNSDVALNSKPYNYIWRVRDPATKVVSNWSPPLREGIRITRGSTVLTPTNASLDFPANYVIDIARWGGALNDYRIVGTIKNDASSFNDNVSDLTAANNPPAGRKLTGNQIGSEEIFDFYKPFVFLDTPKNGTCNVVGTKFTRVGGDVLNVTYPRGTALLIDGKLNRFFTNPTSANNVELEADMGNLNGVNFEIKTPLLTGQPLPNIAGTFGEGNSGLFIFGWGNKKAAGTVYWLDGNSPDTMSDLNFLEITSPSEPILAGGLYDGYLFLYTSKRSFYLIPTFQSGGTGFIARENANSRGVFSPYTFCVGRDFIYFLSENADGIYKVPGSGNPQNLTAGSLSNLFFNNGVPPTPVILIDGYVVFPPNFAKPDEIRLFYCGDVVVFRFVDTENDGKEVAIIFDERIGDWISYDTYFQNRVGAFYRDEIDSDPNLLVGIVADNKAAIGLFEGNTDREDDLETRVLAFSQDAGESNLLKRFEEVVIDANPGPDTDTGIEFKIVYDNGDRIEPLGFYSVDGLADPRRDKFIFKIGALIENLARNITTSLKWKFSTGVKLYEQQFYFLPREDEIQDRASDTEFQGIFGDKYFQSVIIEADTYGEDKELKFRTDDGNEVATIVINHDGKQTRSYSFQAPFIAHSVTRYSTDEKKWIFYNEEYKFDVEPEKGTFWKTQNTTFEIPGYKVVKRVGIMVRTHGTGTLKLFADNVEIYSIPLPDTLGEKLKVYSYIPATKGITFRVEMTVANEARAYYDDMEFWTRQWNSNEDYQVLRPFGNKDYEVGAQ